MKINIKKSDFSASSPYCLFEIKNFLPENFYQDLSQSFPLKSILNLETERWQKTHLVQAMKDFLSS